MAAKMAVGLKTQPVTGNIQATFDALGNVELGGIKLESANKDLLDVSWGDISQHVAMHPSAIAYFGALKKEAARRLAALKRAFDRWQKRKYAEARVAVSSGAAQYKPTVNDVEARFIVDNEKELEDWDVKLDTVQEEFDTLDVYFEAWRQKSYCIREHVSIEEEERFTSGGGSITGGGDAEPRREATSESLQKVREIMRKRRLAGASV